MASTKLTTLKSLYSSNTHLYQMIDNYIYLYHLPNSNGGNGVCIIMPSYADSVTDSNTASFAQTTPIGRSAPIYSYQSSGPRSLQVSFRLHRDMMKEINHSLSNAVVDIDTDYVDIMIKYIQTAVVPTYGASTKMVDPPLVALRLGNDIFIKGVVTNGVSVTYNYPILSNGKYSTVDIGFNISEVDPYNTTDIATNGSFRGFSTSLERNMWVAT